MTNILHTARVLCQRVAYRKIPIISPGLLFVQKAVLLGLFSEAYYWKEFCISKWVGLDNRNSLKHHKNSLKQLTLTLSTGLFLGGLIFRGAYYWNFTGYAHKSPIALSVSATGLVTGKGHEV